MMSVGIFGIESRYCTLFLKLSGIDKLQCPGTTYMCQQEWQLPVCQPLLFGQIMPSFPKAD